jgi:hypothetical protein
VLYISRKIREDSDVYLCNLGHWVSVQLVTGVRVLFIVSRCLVGVKPVCIRCVGFGMSRQSLFGDVKMRGR